MSTSRSERRPGVELAPLLRPQPVDSEPAEQAHEAARSGGPRRLRHASHGGDPQRDRQGAQLPVLLEGDDVERRIVGVGTGVESLQELAKEGRLQCVLVAPDQHGEWMRCGREARREPGERAQAGDRVTCDDDRELEAVWQRWRRCIRTNDHDDLVDDDRNRVDRQVEERAPVNLRGELVARRSASTCRRPARHR